MGLFNSHRQKKFKEYIDIIEWSNDTSESMIWRFPRYKTKIKNGAQLTVRDEQVAVLIDKGRFADVYQPGCYKLTIDNMPILAAIKKWKYGFKSPFRTDIYFVSTKHFWNMHWGNNTPIIINDSKFGSISIEAFGLFCFHVNSNPSKFIRNTTDMETKFTTESVKEQLFNFAIRKFIDYLSLSKINIIDLATNVNDFSNELTIALKNDFHDYGLELTKFSVTEIVLPEDVKKVIEKRNKRDINSKTSTRNNYVIADKLLEEVTKCRDEHPNEYFSPKHRKTMYHIEINGVKLGPLKYVQLEELVERGQFTPDTLVWTTGRENWIKAKYVPSLSQLFYKTPPPTTL